MSKISLEEAQAQLPMLIEQLQPDEEIVITKDEKPVARLVATQQQPRAPRQFGTMKGPVLYMADDFDAPLEFKE